LLGEAFPMPVYLSLLPIIGGCALAAITELNFNMIGMNQITINPKETFLVVQFQYSK
jgi:hypothetical protein